MMILLNYKNAFFIRTESSLLMMDKHMLWQTGHADSETKTTPSYSVLVLHRNLQYRWKISPICFLTGFLE